MSIRKSRIAGDPADYEKLGIAPGQVAPWEDGFRTDGGPGSYEWWYFDSHMEDGTSLVIVAYTKRMLAIGKPLAPYFTIDLDTPDGKHFEERVEHADISFSASKEGCDVQVGSCYFRGDLRQYEIYFDNGHIQAKAKLTSNLPPWRPETGHIYFGDNDEYYFAWLPSVPEGSVEAEITLDGVTTVHKGTGYHDHNWGNILMSKVMHHWYWGRASIGKYNVISSYIYGEKKYGYNEFPIFLLSESGKHIGDDGKKLKFLPSEVFTEPETGKPVHNRLTYLYTDGDTEYEVTYVRKKGIINFPMIEQLKGVVKFLARLIGFDAAYHRFSGDVTLRKIVNDTVEEETHPAIWELMYFGKNI
jgi:hypothetical protein